MNPGSKIIFSILDQAEQQLNEYFAGQRRDFDLPLDVIGTAFQKKVWHELNKIKYGETRSYKDIALAIGDKKACRAVGSANGKNPLSIVVPCHRVIAANDTLCGYAGKVERARLLDLERQRNLRILCGE